MIQIQADRTAITVSDGSRILRTAPWDCRIILPDGRVSRFSDAVCASEPLKNGIGAGVKQRWSGFPEIPALELECRIYAENATGDIIFELIPIHDAEIEEILWPAPFENPKADAYTVLPLMQGALVPNYTKQTFPDAWDIIPGYTEYRHSCSRSMYMSFFGQYDGEGGSMTILETRYDAAMTVQSGEGQPVLCAARWRESLGMIRYPRRLRVKCFAPGADYNDMAQAYRAYVDAQGELITLKQKAAKNPKVKELIGKPIVHTHIWYHTQPDSDAYDKDHPEKNDRRQSFDAVGEKLRRLKDHGLMDAVVHLDGWGRRGYDNQHPDYLPPAEDLGGWDGMKRLANTCHKLGYFFGTHDQYRDYFYDADTFDESYAVHNRDGGVSSHAIWMGGKQTFLCATQAPYYVRRNFGEIKAHDIHLDNTYLDVFSCVELDECYSPEHPMTREQCAEYRMKCFDLVSSDGILVQSEEGIDWAFPGLIFVHHAPFAPSNCPGPEKSAGIPIPLLEMVYHDCLITPYTPSGDNLLFGWLTGGATYIDEDADAETIAECNARTAWQKQVQMRKIIHHELIDGNPCRQKVSFEGGFTAEIDLDHQCWTVSGPRK
ncbi:MAG: DUF5696 domain-containing protein [Clostridia bacterium]|nr:DUF5696 domain-containing protein [Clostridia bacterium]